MKNTMTGNRALLKVGGKTIGGGTQSVNISDDFGLQDVDGLGSAETLELVHGKLTHTITLSRYFIYNQKLDDLGYAPNVDQILNSGELEIEIIDRASGKTLESYSGCKLASHTRDYSKHNISGENAVFRARHREAA